MKYCMKCRKGISNNGIYCPYCGGKLVDYSDVKNTNHIKTCKKCNKDFPPQYKKCIFCGGDLVDKNTFWDAQKVIDCIKIDDKQRLIIEITRKNGNEFVSIGKQYFNVQTGDFVYRTSIPVPVDCVDALISVLKSCK